MRIIGVDPGLTVTGLGVIEAQDDTCTHLFHGCLRPKRLDGGTRLTAIRDEVRDLARRWEVDAGAVEAGFVGLNARSAMALGEARAAAILGLADAGVRIYEYSPATVKQTVSGHGGGGKAQVAEMVRLQLRLETPPSPLDAADALAVAITHWAHSRLLAREQRQTG